MTIKEYAASRGISFEAARKQVSRYEEELADHISTAGRLRVLDDEAVAFLDQHRQVHAVVQGGADPDELERLRAENERLRSKLEAMADRVITLQNDQLQIATDKARIDLLIEEKTRTDELVRLQEKQIGEQTAELEEARKAREAAEEEAQKAEERAEGLKSRAAELEDQKAAAEREAASYQRTWFGFYRKI